MIKSIINPAYIFLSDFVLQIPAIFDSEGDVIYKDRNQIKRFFYNQKNIAVKSYKIPIFINQFVYSFFRPSKAKRAYNYAMKLLDKRIKTPEPIAYIEERKTGLLKRSYFIYLYEDNVTHIREEMLGNCGEKEFEKALAGFIAFIHNQGVMPIDLSPGNILYKKENGTYIFSLIDINRMKFFSSIPKHLRYENFKRISEDRKIITHIAQAYAEYANLNKEDTVREIFKQCDSFYRKKFGKPIP